MPACPTCGRDNQADARFCNACGAALEAPIAEQRKVVTALFCDLVGSTALGESTDPEALRLRMRRYFEDVRSILERHGGTVEKYIGDAVMAVFGIPTAHEDDALRAARAAVEMRNAVTAHGFDVRIGINTGEVVVGGEEETPIVGDAVNVAARLEQAAGSGEILIGTQTRLLVRDAVRVEPVEPLALKGKSQPVEAYRLLEVVSGAAPLVRHLETPLVGRERERARLWRDYEDAVAERSCRLFTLLGPAGIGKSRLVSDFLERVRNSADVLRGRCLSYGEGITYWPLAEMLAPLGIDPESVVASTPEETRVTFRRFVEARAVDRPQVVVVDDLQWAEPALVDLVEHVADLSRGAPILLLCIARTELLDSRPDWGGGKLNATSLLLEPLGLEECALFIEQLGPGVSLDPGLRERITVASAGNPLFMEEMLAMVREHGGGELAVPPTIHALLQARIDSLEPDVRLVIERGAVEGEVFHRGSVVELVPEGLRSSVDVHLTSLVRKELIRPDASRIAGEDAFRFRHILIRDAAYGAMPKELRAELHERFSGWLDRAETSSAFEQDEILGYHLERAYRLRTDLGRTSAAQEELARRAGTKLVAAGARALGRTDLGAAESLLERGVDLLPRADPRRLEALPDFATALVRRGRLDRAEETLRSAIQEAREAGDERSEARARLALNSLRKRIDPEVVVEDELADALEIAASLERLGDESVLARAYLEIGMCRFMLGHAADGEADLRKALDLARKADDRARERDSMTSRLRPMAWGPAPASDGVDFCTALVESELANVADRAGALHVRSLFEAMQGDFDAARDSARTSAALIEEFGLTLQRGLYGIDVGYALLLAGDLAEAEQVTRGSYEVLVEIGDTGARSSLMPILADVLVRRERYDEAEALIEECREIAGKDDLDAQPRWRMVLARIRAQRGELDEAEGLVREAAALAEPTDFLSLKGDVHDVLAEVLTRAGRFGEAADAVERAVALHELKGNVVSAGRSLATLNELRATPS